MSEPTVADPRPFEVKSYQIYFETAEQGTDPVLLRTFKMMLTDNPEGSTDKQWHAQIAFTDKLVKAPQWNGAMTIELYYKREEFAIVHAVLEKWFKEGRKVWCYFRKDPHGKTYSGIHADPIHT